MNKKFQLLKIKLTIDTPTHVGSDEEFSVPNIAIDSDQKHLYYVPSKDFGYYFTLGEMESLLNPLFSSANPMKSLFELSSKLAKQIKVKGRSPNALKIPIGQGIFNEAQKLMSNLSNPNAVRNFAIFRTSYLTFNANPYLPGSSIKGAIRTAILNQIREKKQIQHANSGSEYVKLVFGSNNASYTIQNDPLKNLQVSDFYSTEDKQIATEIGFANRVYPNNSIKEYLSNMVEVIKPNQEFFGTIKIISDPDHSINLNWDFVKSSIISYYGLGSDNQLHLRIGKYTGSLAKTDKKLRSIRTKYGNVTVPKTHCRYAGSKSFSTNHPYFGKVILSILN